MSAIIIEIFTRVAAEPTTAHELSNPEILSKVAAVAASAEGRYVTVFCYIFLCAPIDVFSDPNKSTAMSLLLLCFQKESSVKDEMVLAVMPAFAETFESCNGAYKFDVLKMAVELLLGWQVCDTKASRWLACQSVDDFDVSANKSVSYGGSPVGCADSQRTERVTAK